MFLCEKIAMPAKQHRPRPPTEAAAFNITRTETALSRYPVNELAKHGLVYIDIREENEHGELEVKWEVSYNSKYGQPGPLAYKLDTLVINRRIEEAPRPLTKFVKLGSLRDICRELGLSDGENKNSIKKALCQNSFAGITAKLSYKMSDDTQRRLEADFTRYAVVFTGEKFPDGRTADAVYLILNDIYMQVINGARTRPLDYDDLKGLPPAPQRFYELVSYQIFAALKHGRSRAKLAYSEYCTYAPQARYFDFDRVKKQMYKLHAPHKKSGYLAEVEFRATADRERRPDWLIFYTPGPKARAEYQAFTSRGGLVLDVEPAQGPAPALLQPEQQSGLAVALVARGVTAATAAELVGSFPAEQIETQIEALDWLIAKKDRRVSKSPGGYLADAIRKRYTLPEGFETRAEQAQRQQAERRKRRRSHEARRQVESTRRAVEEARRGRIRAYWESLEPVNKEALRPEPSPGRTHSCTAVTSRAGTTRASPSSISR